VLREEGRGKKGRAGFLASSVLPKNCHTACGPLCRRKKDEGEGRTRLLDLYSNSYHLGAGRHHQLSTVYSVSGRRGKKKGGMGRGQAVSPDTTIPARSLIFTKELASALALPFLFCERERRKEKEGGVFHAGPTSYAHYSLAPTREIYARIHKRSIKPSRCEPTS